MSLGSNPLRDAQDRRLPRIAGPCSLVLFGVTGDLARKKLIPAVYDLANRGLLPPGFALVGFARQDFGHQEFKSLIKKAAKDGARTPWRETVWKQLVAGIRFVPGEFDDDAAWERLGDTMHELDEQQGTNGNHAFYLSIPPALFPIVVSQLKKHGLATPGGGPGPRDGKFGGANGWRRVVIEKPFGHDLTSARELNEIVGGVFPPESVFRIDHYLGEGAKNGVLPENLKKDRDIAQIQRDNFRAAHRAGARMVFGSDAGVMPHGSAGGQFRYMVEYGMSPMEAIQAATRNGALALGRERDVGAIAAGRWGDIVAVDGDPLAERPRARKRRCRDQGRRGREDRLMAKPLDGARIRRRFPRFGQLSADELEDWLATPESRRVGFKKDGGESVGHASGRRIVAILRAPADMDDERPRLHAQGGRLRPPPPRPGAGQHGHVALALFADELGPRSADKRISGTAAARPALGAAYRIRKGKRAMKGYVDNIERRTVENEDFRRVLYTGEHLQLVLMTLPPGCDIGEEVHEDRDQFFRIEEGEGEIRIDGAANRVEDDFAVIVPAGARHNVINTGDKPLRLYTIYGPPEHRDKVVHKTKEDAERDHDNDHWDGETSE